MLKSGIAGWLWPDTLVGALQGLSDAYAEKLQSALGIKTVKDLGTNKFFLWGAGGSKARRIGIEPRSGMRTGALSDNVAKIARYHHFNRSHDQQVSAPFSTVG